MSAKLDQYRYAAPADIAGSLAEHDRLKLNVYTLPDGHRRFVPWEEEGLDGYNARAFQLGHSRLTRDRGWSKETFDDYLIGKEAYDWLCHARERLWPRNLTTEDLVTPGRLRRAVVRRDALPDELTEGEGEFAGSQRISQLAASGVMAAAVRTIREPTEMEILALGLMDAARSQPPLAATEDQIVVLVRDALFYFADDERVSPAVWDEVGEQFERAVRNRLDISQEKFNAWLYGKRAYMLKTVERASELGKVDDRRALVRRAMLEQAWRGFTMVSECLDAFAETFERALTRPLNVVERTWFRSMYRRQPYYGNLALPLLLDFKDLLEHAVLDLWEKPGDEQAIDVFHRMLLYRSQIIPRVRETQRRARASKRAVLESSSADGVVREATVWSHLTGHLLEQREIECAKCDLPPICLLMSDEKERTRIQLEVACATHGDICKLTITQGELAAAHQALYG